MGGIAGLIHRGKASKVGHELQGQLRALQHRGARSTRSALYAATDPHTALARKHVECKLPPPGPCFQALCLQTSPARPLLASPLNANFPRPAPGGKRFEGEPP